jgi:acylphosphatase
MDTIMAVKITITGKVHDVGYRLFLLEEADFLLIPHFDARNVKINGKEALIVLVDGEKEQITEFVEFVKTNKPENAVVDRIEVEEYTGRVRDIERFRSSFNTAQLSKIVQVGLKMLQKQDETIKVIKEESEKTRRELGSKIDETRKELGDKIDETRKELGSKIDNVNDNINLLRSDLKEYTGSNLKNIREEILEIKEALRRAGIM